MADIISTYSDYERFVLKSDFADSLILKQEPDGWDEETVKLTRHKTYHGIFISYTGKLKFFNEAKDYIQNAYVLGGINTNLRLTRYLLKDKDGEVKWVEDYSLIADYLTMRIEGSYLEINFNSNELEELIKSHETDTFEIERLDSIDDVELEKLKLYKLELSGRALSGIGENVININHNKKEYQGKEYLNITAKKQDVGVAAVADTKIGNFGDRHGDVDITEAEFGMTNGKCFIVATTDPNEIAIDARIEYDVSLLAQAIGVCKLKASLFVYQWGGVEEPTSFTIVQSKTKELFRSDNIGDVDWDYHPFSFSGVEEVTLEYNECAMIGYTLVDWGANAIAISCLFDKHTIKLSTDSFYEKSQDISFSFIHDIVDRLMYIITGEKGRFYSRYFGRTELNEEAGYDYNQDGEGGLIGALSGFWARAFDPNSEKYKSLQISLKDAITSLQAVFNVGVTIETVNLKQRLRFEKLEYYYRNEVVIKLPNQINNVSRIVDKDLFFSGTDFGYEYGGNYEDQVGLDEPNTRTKTVTPIRKSTNKYQRISKIRSDETGLELVRKKPQVLFPDEDTGTDEHNWFLDLKRGEIDGYEEKIWSDRLKELPTGINFPENYKTMFFTPLRMMLRHGFVLRAGMEPYLNKYIKYANSEDNTNLKTHAKEDWNQGIDEAIRENDDILVSKLNRARFLPEIIECSYSIDSSLMDLIKGTTKVLIDGKYEDVPNTYFKFEFLNEDEKLETGYLLEVTPGRTGKFKFQKANENII
jgi:hypothetical protein